MTLVHVCQIGGQGRQTRDERCSLICCSYVSGVRRWCPYHMSCGASSSGNDLPHKKGIDVMRRGEEETGTG